jgi:hypothetical protein
MCWILKPVVATGKLPTCVIKSVKNVVPACLENCSRLVTKPLILIFPGDHAANPEERLLKNYRTVPTLKPLPRVRYANQILITC